MIKYCLPIIVDKKEKVLQMVNFNLSDFTFFELWLDYIDDLDSEFIDYVISNFEEKIIFVFRRKKLEEMKMSEDKRQKYLWQIGNSQAFLDLDIIAQENDLAYLKGKNIKVNLILSYHNYQETPEKDELEKSIKEMEQNNPLIYKISTFCKDQTDAVVLLNLLEKLKKGGKKFIVLGMGKNGLVTRIFGTLWGNEMIFAPISLNESSAEGQLTKREMEEIFRRIKV